MIVPFVGSAMRSFFLDAAGFTVARFLGSITQVDFASPRSRDASGSGCRIASRAQASSLADGRQLAGGKQRMATFSKSFQATSDRRSVSQ
jgi:hypothetical protein